MVVRALKQPHDVYVALSFASADLLFELDRDGTVTWVAGAAEALLGRPAGLLADTPLSAVLHPTDHERFDRVLAAMADGVRVRNVLLEAERLDGGRVHVTVSGYRHPDHADRFLVSMAHATGFLPPPEGRRAAQSGLLDKDSFEARARHLLSAPPADEPYRLTLLDLPELDSLRAEAGTEAVEALVGQLGESLRSLSLGGDAAGQLSDTKYGLIHSGSVDADEIGRAVTTAMAICAPHAPPLEPQVSTLVLDVAGTTATDAARALAYTLNCFAAENHDGQAVDGFAACLQPRLSATVAEMKAMRRTITLGEFEMVFQPIVDMWTNVVHHFECLVRFGDRALSPYQAVTFAEDTGLVGELDLAVVERITALMRASATADAALRFAVNLSGRTLSDPSIVGRLRAMLRASRDLAGRLLLEITESAAITDLAAVNAVVQDIRQMGFEVCLDDFGAGAAAFHYLRALKVDHVKIDGSYVRECMNDSESVAFIKAMVGLCSELGITTTAEFVENAETANLLKVLKVRYGQGWWFGKPYRPDLDTDAPRLAWGPDYCRWRKGLLVFQR